MRSFWSDLLAGVTVALVALPLSIAIAIASGAPPASGLITAIIGGFIISALGGSRVQIGGPTGAFIVVVYNVVQHHGYSGLLVATMMAGTILLIAGFLRSGYLIRHVPHPVVEGFTIGIAFLIAISQLQYLLGMEAASLPADLMPRIEGLWARRASIDELATLMGVLSITAILFLSKLAPKVPWLIIVVAIASLLGVISDHQFDTVASLYGRLPNSIPHLTFPAIDGNQLIELLPSAFTIAFLAGIESLLSARVADRMLGSSHRSNAELIAQGTANFASPLFGGLPVTGAIARTATNVSAGGRTPIAGIVHALALLAAFLWLSSLVGHMAMPSLAAILMVTAWRMSEPDRWKVRFGAPLGEQILIALTATLTVLVDLTAAILIGTVIGFIHQRWFQTNELS